MATIYYENDIDSGVLSGKAVAVAGYGEEGRAHALNLRDSGVEVLVSAAAGTADARRAGEDGFTVADAAGAAARADVVMLLEMNVLEREILPNLTENKTLLFAHGFAVHYRDIEFPDNIDVVLLAPQAPGRVVRDEFARGAGVPCLAAVHRDFSGNALKTALAYGRAIGGARAGAGIIESTFREATESELFASQAVLAGGVPELLRAAFDTLVDGGCQPEAAYAGLAHQLALCMDIVRGGGLAGLAKSLSRTAEYGGCTRGQRIVGDASRDAMQEVFGEIRNGVFAREWLCENMTGKPVLKQMRARADAHPLDAAGKKIRGARNGQA